jgi:GNAT superfamily N-acetyltransferase
MPPLEWNPKHETFAAMMGDQYVGYVRITINSGVCYLDEILVAKKARRGGIGRSLLKFLEAYCRKRGCHKLSLQTSEQHKEALAFYERMGFLREAVHGNDLGHLTWYTLVKFI